MASTYNFVIHPASTALAIAVENRGLICDQVLNVVPINAPVYEYPVLATASSMTVPETIVSRTGRPRTVEFSSRMQTGTVLDQFLDNPIPVAEQMAADAPGAVVSHNPEILASSMVFTNLVKLRQEWRVAGMLFNPANYGVSNKTTLLAGSQFNNATFNPIPLIRSVINSQIVKPNIMAIGEEGWLGLCVNPYAVEAVKATGAGSGAIGVVTPDELAPILGLKKILVGESYINLQGLNAPVYTRCWGKHALLLHRAEVIPSMQYAYTFGVIPTFGNVKSMVAFDPFQGAFGSIVHRIGMQADERIISSEFAHLLINVVP
jgi:hypothetical protein